MFNRTVGLTRPKVIRIAVWACLVLARWPACAAQDTMSQEFVDPPSTAAPRVWWHWMNGNITQDGIEKDLDWMHRIGIGGVQIFDAALDTPQVVNHRLTYMTPEWDDALRLAVNRAQSLGMEVAIPSSPGWSESGGPWVAPSDAMKKMVWSETTVVGGYAFHGRLEKPPDVVGPFQDVPAVWGPISYTGPTPAVPVPNLYKDVAVIAYRQPESELPLAKLQPLVTSSGGRIDSESLWYGSPTEPVRLPLRNNQEPAWIELKFPRLVRVQSVTVGMQHPWDGVSARYVAAILEASNDGAVFRRVADAYDINDISSMGLPPAQMTVTFAPVTARFFRLVLPQAPPVTIDPLIKSLLPPPDRERLVTKFILHSAPRVDHVEQKAAFFLANGHGFNKTRSATRGDVVDPRSVINLTDHMRSDGSLTWNPPPGRWCILRVGYSLLGVTNHPATIEATGLEVDKLNAQAVEAYMQEYLRRYERIVGAASVGLRGIHAVVNDSYESGAQNWTDELPTEFAHRRGYSLYAWLPVLTGKIVGSSSSSDRFLWDFRRTLGELIAQNHYARITEVLHARGLIHYGESHEQQRAFFGDGMDVKRHVDIPMGAMWAPGWDAIPQSFGDADIRESASVAHIYGQQLVAAESMTIFGRAGLAFAYAPEELKSTADRELSDGLNLFVIHTSVHQPRSDLSPGLTLGPYGQWFTRQETWSELAAPWVRYLARSSYLLQQGRFVADVLYCYGEDTNITALYSQQLPPVPAGYAFDFINASALTVLAVKDGLIEAPSGSRYRAIVLDPRIKKMSLDMLRSIARLVREGAIVVGEKPLETPSLADDEAVFKNLTSSLWGDGSAGERGYGFGKILAGRTLEKVLLGLRIAPDFRTLDDRPDSSIRFVHRHLTQGDLYFVDNGLDREQRIEADFRVNGLTPELWHADTGEIEPASYREHDGRTIVPLTLGRYDAVFVVFRKPIEQTERTIPEWAHTSLMEVRGPWMLSFQSGRGAPAQVRLETLSSWSENKNPGIRYFSGVAEYKTTLIAPRSWFDDNRYVEIDLGQVKNIAEVRINGKLAGTCWKAPFRLEVRRLLRPGSNEIAIRVANLWVNRLIGDKQPSASPVAVTTLNPYGADSPLLESGLLGPVEIEERSIVSPVRHEPQRRSPNTAGDTESANTRSFGERQH